MTGNQDAYVAETITLTERILSASFGSVVRLDSAPQLQGVTARMSFA